jgi:hypothetical protein
VTEVIKAFYNNSKELYRNDITWVNLKEKFYVDLGMQGMISTISLHYKQ